MKTTIKLATMVATVATLNSCSQIFGSDDASKSKMNSSNISQTTEVLVQNPAADSCRDTSSVMQEHYHQVMKQSLSSK